MEASSYWTIYVHDKHEHFLLSSYSMANLPKITISKPRVKGKKKIMLFPGNTQSPSANKLLFRTFQKNPVTETRTAVNTPTNPCNSTREYSHNLCQLKACWKSRLLRVKERYQSLFQCQIPGIVIDLGEALPVCDHLIMAREEKTYLGKE